MKFLPDQLKKLLESVVSDIVESLNLEFQIKSHLLSDQQKSLSAFLKVLERQIVLFRHRWFFLRSFLSFFLLLWLFCRYIFGVNFGLVVAGVCSAKFIRCFHFSHFETKVFDSFLFECNAFQKLS